jgi:hypothetical protein
MVRKGQVRVSATTAYIGRSCSTRYRWWCCYSEMAMFGLSVADFPPYRLIMGIEVSAPKQSLVHMSREVEIFKQITSGFASSYSYVPARDVTY